MKKIAHIATKQKTATKLDFTGFAIVFLLSNCQRWDYIIPSDNRELQQPYVGTGWQVHYIIPSDNRELQRSDSSGNGTDNYIIPSDNEENQKSILKLRKNCNQK